MPWRRARNDAKDDAGDRRAEREAMVRDEIEARGVTDARVLDALRAVPRHRCLPLGLPTGPGAGALAARAYADVPLPIGHGQTISQPYIVAYMSAALELRGDECVLEVGAGCGYQTAILARLAREVHALEIVPELAELARANLAALGVQNAFVHCADGRQGWPDHAPYGAILVAAASAEIPRALVEQLAPGGRLVLPLGDEEHQELVLVERVARGTRRTPLISVRFVPLVLRAGGAGRDRTSGGRR